MAVNNKKKIAIIGIAVLLVMSTVTCDILQPEEDEIVYTDVLYSKNGSEVDVTVYLDGITVPVTKAQRAMSRPLAEMSFDFLEVVFVSGTNVARASWELGQPAGISGIVRDINYGTVYGAAAGAGDAAIFAGKSSDKTLFGVGHIIEVNGVAGTTITGATESVKFRIGAVTTGLGTSAETVSLPLPSPLAAPNIRGILAKSFTFSDAAAPYNTLTTANSSLLTLGKTPYPLYTMQTVAANLTVNATYTFAFGGTQAAAGAGDVAAVRNWAGATYVPKVQKRAPRYVDGGAFREPKDHTDTKTEVAILPAYLTAAAVANSAFNRIVALTFLVKPTSSGLFSFFLEIPVYCINNGAANKNNGPAATRWYVRTGFGSDLYNIDDGEASGGCVLMGVGASSSDWIWIDWDWVQ